MNQAGSILTFDPNDLDGLTDPYPLFAEIRAGGAVQRLTSGFWMITGHAAALEALHHPSCGSSPIAMRYLEGLPPGAARNEMSHRINFLDPPDHPRVRGIVSKAFTPRRTALLRPWMEETATRLLDELQSHLEDHREDYRDGRLEGHREDHGDGRLEGHFESHGEGHGEIDLLHQFAHQLPSLVISELLGVPSADRNRLTAWSDAVAPLLGVHIPAEKKAAAIAAAEDFHAYLSALLDDRASNPGDDLLSALLAAEADGQRLQRVELMSLAATLYSAGHRTTRDLFANGMSVLLSEPERYRNVAEGRWAIPAVIDEFLRYETPTLFVARVPLAAVIIGGVEIGPWEPMLVFLSAANRDPAVHEEPDTFRPGRSGPAPISFAFGAHFCLGASLARSEAEVMLGAVASRWPDLRLHPERVLRWHQRGPFRGLDELAVVRGG